MRYHVILNFDFYSILEEEQKKKEEEKRKREEDKKFKQPHQNLMNNAEGQAENKTSEANPNAPHHPKMKKNFASQDCGAKIAGANAEAQSALNVITPSRYVTVVILGSAKINLLYKIQICLYSRSG